MIFLEKAIASDRLIKATIGMSQSAFDELLVTFTLVWDEYVLQKIKEYKGAQAWAPRNTHRLDTPKKKLFFLLFTLKTYPTFDLLGLFFGADKSRTNRWFHEYLPLLEKTLGKKCLLPKRKIGSIEEFLNSFPGTEDLFIDGTERPIQRPKDKEARKEKYSGKKKRHTEKNLLGVSASGEILLLGKTTPGSHHDMRMLKDSEWLEKIPKELCLWVDSGFQGLKKELPTHEINLPYKGIKDGVIGNMKREINKIISSIRVGVEHAIGHVKRLRCLTDVSRTRKDKVRDLVILIGCGIWNLQRRHA